MISIKNLSKSYGDKVALKNINLCFSHCGLVGIVGECGSGKTTLFNLLMGAISPSEGSIFFDEEELKYTSKINEFNKFSIMFQDGNLLEELTVYENILVCANEKTIEKVDNILKKLKIFKFKNTLVKKLSGGEKQRVVIARALIMDCPIILADEPTANLDSVNAKNVATILKEISKYKLVLLITHNSAIVKDYADRIIELDKGSIIKDIVINDNNGALIYDKCDKPSYKYQKSIIRKITIRRVKSDFFKNLTSVFILMLISVFVLLPLSVVTIKLKKSLFNELDSTQYTFSDDKNNFYEFKNKMQNKDLSKATKFFYYDNKSIIIDDNLDDGSVFITKSTFDGLNIEDKNNKTIKINNINFKITKIVEDVFADNLALNLVFMSQNDCNLIYQTNEIVITSNKNKSKFTVIINNTLSENDIIINEKAYIDLVYINDKLMELQEKTFVFKLQEIGGKYLGDTIFEVKNVIYDTQESQYGTIYVSEKKFLELKEMYKTFGFLMQNQPDIINYYLDQEVILQGVAFDKYYQMTNILKVLNKICYIVFAVAYIGLLFLLSYMLNHLITMNIKDNYVLMSLNYPIKLQKLICYLVAIFFVLITIFINILIFLITILVIEPYVIELVPYFKFNLLSSFIYAFSVLSVAVVLIAIKVETSFKNFSLSKIRLNKS